MQTPSTNDIEDLAIESARLRARITDLERSLEWRDAVFSAMPGLLVVLDETGRFVEWSQRHSLLLGRMPQDGTSDLIFTDVHPDDQAAVAFAFADAVAGGESAVEARILTVFGPQWYALRACACDIGGNRCVVVSGTDIEAGKRAEAELRSALRRAEMLARMSVAIAGGSSIGEMAAKLARDTRETFGVDACVIRVLSEGTLRLLACDGVPPDILPERLPVYGIAKELLENRQPLVIRDVAHHEVTRDVERDPSRFEFHSYAGAPLCVGDEMLGVMGIYSVAERRDFTTTDVHHLTIVANQVAVALRNAMLYQTVIEQQNELKQAAADLERRVEDRTKELRETVAELESFTYSIAHDLRSPIRAMVGYAALIEEEHGAELGPNGLRYVNAVRSNAIRLGRLVDGLLEFSRLGRRAMHCMEVLPRDLIEAVLAEESPAMAGRDIDIEIGELPPCHADPHLLRVVFQNLIDNALKFTRPREKARIEIGSAQERGQTVYFVRDNGIGFDTRYAERMFGVFQRLEADGRFEGSGVGLAIVQRIVQRHSGQVWAASQPEEGATFFFTLGPQADRSDA